MVNTKEIKADLSKIYRNYATDYDFISTASFDKYRKDLKPGQIVEEKGRFFFPDDEQRFIELAREHRDKGLEIVNHVRSEIRKAKSEAPSTDAVNYISMLRNQKNITDRDIDAAVERYGNNYTAYRAIRDIAIEWKIYNYGEDPIDKVDRGLDDVEANLNKMGDTFNMQKKGFNSGHCHIFDAMLDMSIPNCTF